MYRSHLDDATGFTGQVVGRRGRVLSTRFAATIEGGPELATALARLDDAVRVRASKDALLAAGDVIATEWRSRVPVLDANYQAALDKAPRAAKTKAGASGSVAPRKVAGVPDDEQPVRYAGRLEFGDGDRAAEPSARPAFDATRERAVEAAVDVLERAVAGVTR
jgi:HK97 gp10 family phage protein